MMLRCARCGRERAAKHLMWVSEDPKRGWPAVPVCRTEEPCRKRVEARRIAVFVRAGMVDFAARSGVAKANGNEVPK